MTRWISAIGVGILLLLAEMVFATPDVSARVPGGPFDRMSPGNQKVARALFEAQKSELPPGARPLTLDQIAARKQSGKGWGRVFDGMKSQGLVNARNLGQAISSSNQRHHLSPSGSVSNAAHRSVRNVHVGGTASGRTHGMAAARVSDHARVSHQASISNQVGGGLPASSSQAPGHRASGMSVAHGTGRGK